MLAIIGGDPVRFAPYADLYRRALAQLEAPELPIGVHSPGFVGRTDDEAREQFWPQYKKMRDRIGADRGWPPMARAEFDHEAGPHGSLYVGSPETVAQKIANTVKAVGASRFDLKYSAGPLSHDLLMTCIELYGTRVIPRVRELLAE
jgi:alkanesulfonate monooxygenase SsuD/methylene tetrahydromethanopterin reductase-like flavin-dependent oxidoreductase (luciferase family)